MPTYTYQCKECSHRYDAFQSIKDEPHTLCPSCNVGLVERVIAGGAGIHFKGSGFYVNDYKKTNSPAASSSSSDGVAVQASNSATTSEKTSASTTSSS